MNARALALAAHPDDVEFCMAGTFILLGQAGCDLHYMNIADGSCGSMQHDAQTIAAIRLDEARNAAHSINATFHPPLVPDIEIFYEKALLARVASVIRDIGPDILLLPSPEDYMEDHMTACRLGVTAAFCRAMPNFEVNPARPPVQNDTTVYHAQPYANRAGLNRLVYPDFFIDISGVIDRKRAMLAKHKSQKEWLDRSQGVNAYLDAMHGQGRELGELSGQFEFAEGWRRHNPLGFCASHADPMKDLLQDKVLEWPDRPAVG